MLADNLLAAPDIAALHDFNAALLAGANLDRGEVTVLIHPTGIVDVCRFLKNERQFERLSTVTAVDRYPREPRFEIVYHLHSLSRNQRIRLKCAVSGESPSIDSVTSIYLAADWYEREVFDLFGVQFRHHPNLKRLLMPEDWQGHPLRKDYPVHGHRYDYKDE